MKGYMKKNWRLIIGIACLCFALPACSDNSPIENVGNGPTEEPGYENDNEITGEKDLRIKVIKASGTVNNKEKLR